MVIDGEKVEEYRGLLIQSGLSENTVNQYMKEIDGFLFLYDGDISDENIDDYADCANSYILERNRRRIVGLFKEWVLYGVRPRRSVHWKDDEREKAPPKEEQLPEKRYYDNMYNKIAVYKDSHSAQWY